jgi:hypothetical protein
MSGLLIGDRHGPSIVDGQVRTLVTLARHDRAFAVDAAGSPGTT